MQFGKLDQAWSFLYDQLHLNYQLERALLDQLRGGKGTPLTQSGLSATTLENLYATQLELSDYFRERRDYIEAIATLDMVIAVERAIREDLKERQQGLKSATSLVGLALVSTSGSAGGTQPPAARRLLPHWRLANQADPVMIDAIDQGMQFRNWLVHGTIGIAPFSPNPFLLDDPVNHLIQLISNES